MCCLNLPHLPLSSTPSMDTAVHPKHWYISMKLHGITWPNPICSIFMLVRNSNLTKLHWSSSKGDRSGPLVIIVEFISIKNTAFCQKKWLQSKRTHNNLGSPRQKIGAPIIFIDVAPKSQSWDPEYLPTIRRADPSPKECTSFIYNFWEPPTSQDLWGP
jgi:hypothetical protein